MKQKGFTIVPVIIIAVVVIVGGVGGYLYLKNKNKPVVCTQETKQLNPEQKKIKEVIENFYRTRIFPSHFVSYKKSPYLTDGLKKKIDQIISSFEGGPGYDPILCAQDIPAYVCPEEIVIKDNEANVIVSDSFWAHIIPINPEVHRYYSITLEKVNRDWKISDINCMDPIHERLVNFKVYYYDKSKENSSCNGNSISAVDRKEVFPYTYPLEMEISDIITSLISRPLTEEEKNKGLSKDFIDSLEIWVSPVISFKNGDLTVSLSINQKVIDDIISKNPCQFNILKAQIESTAKQFPEIKQVETIIEPEK